MSGQKFNIKNDFEHVSYLGKGAFGVASLFRDKRTQNYVAIKSIKKAYCHTLYGMDALRRELLLQYGLVHENIVRLYAFFYDKDFVHMVMEPCETVTLEGVLEIRKGKDNLSVHRVAYIADSIAAALQYCHARQIIHRDVKPANILFCDGKPKLADFGVSTRLHERRQFSIVGTPEYGPPEYGPPELICMSETRGHNHKVDVWSLGVVFYEMLEGVYPFEGMTEVQKKETTRTGEFRRAKSVPDWAKPLIKQMLKRSYRDRMELAAFRADRDLRDEVKKFHRHRLYAKGQGN